MDAALRKVITTVLLLTAIYVLCWSPYWVSMFANRIFSNLEQKSSTLYISFSKSVGGSIGKQFSPLE